MSITTLFWVLQGINVVLSTIKSLTTIKCGKVVASVISALYYAYYTIVIVYTVADFSLTEKVIITFTTNLIGVFVVKLFEEKMRKDKLWKVETTVRARKTEDVRDFLEGFDIPYNYATDETGRYSIFNIYCKTQKESLCIKELVDKYDAKYFVSESKVL